MGAGKQKLNSIREPQLSENSRAARVSLELTHCRHIILLSWGTLASIPNLHLGLTGILPQKGSFLCLFFNCNFSGLNGAV